MTSRPLAGIKVADFSRVLAGPLCTQYLGDMGADVIKIETIGHGDDMRVWPPFKRSADGQVVSGTPYLAVNRNKRGIAIDLKSTEGRDIAHRLAAQADVVIESFGPGAAERLGLDAATLRALNPRLIHCSISGYGTQGPMRHGKGYDSVLQAFSGMMSITGEPQGGPVRVVFSPIDQGTGMHALTGILAALHERHATGQGTSIEVSLFDTAAGFLAHMLQNYWQRGTEPERYGVAHESLCPYEAFDTADRPMLLGVANDAMWQAFCRIAGIEAFADDPRFVTSGERVRHRDACVALVRSALLKQPRDKWIVALEAAGIPCSPLHTLGELSSHPHTRASGMVFDYLHPSFGVMSGVAQPVRFDGQRTELRRPPPLLGEHTLQVLQELGLDRAAIEALQARGVIRGPVSAQTAGTQGSSLKAEAP